MSWTHRFGGLGLGGEGKRGGSEGCSVFMSWLVTAFDFFLISRASERASDLQAVFSG